MDGGNGNGMKKEHSPVAHRAVFFMQQRPETSGGWELAYLASSLILADKREIFREAVFL